MFSSISGASVAPMSGASVAPSITHTSGVTAIVYTPPAPFAPGSSNFVHLAFGDTAAVFQTNTFSFIVAGAVIPPSAAVPPGSVDRTQVGFRVRTYQTTAAQPGIAGVVEGARIDKPGLSLDGVLDRERIRVCMSAVG